MPAGAPVVPQNQQTVLTLRAIADVPAYPAFDLNPTVVDVSWARGGRVYLEITAGSGPGPIYLATSRATAAAGKLFVGTVRDLSTLTPVGVYEAGALAPYLDALDPSVDAVNFWLESDGTMFYSINVSEANQGLTPARVVAYLVPQYTTPR